ncbi:MAG: hypothetical protein WC536_00640 [Patescibacteria group bacterium]
MVSVKVKNSDGVIGHCEIESWANPKTHILDFVYDNGDTKPEYKNDLEYLDIEKN